MANDQGDSPAAGGKKRRPATIDLKASEIVPDAVNPVEPSDSPTETKPPEPQPGAEDASAAAEPAPAAATMESPQPDSARASATDERLSPPGHPGPRADWRVAAAGAAGAGIMFLLFLIVHAAGAFSPPDQTAPLAERLAALEP